MKIDKRLKAKADMRTQLPLTRTFINATSKINVKFSFLILDFRKVIFQCSDMITV
jgi:hypothetical protein